MTANARPSSGGPRCRRGWARLLAAVALAALSVAVFSPALDHDFVNYDDDRYITGNARVRDGLSAEGVRWAATATPTGTWHPLTWLSHMLDVELFGVQPRGHHLVSLLLHAAAAVLLFLVLDSMTGALGRSALAAALFAAHPLHVESVAWVAERKDVLCACFWLLTVAAYLRYVRRRSPGGYALVLLAFSGGLMAKPMVVTLPFALLLLDWWPLGRFSPGRAPATGGGARPSRGLSPGAILLEKAPLIVLAGILAVATYLAQGEAGTLNLALEPHLGRRVANALSAWVGYAVRSLHPAGLAVFYPLPSLPLPWWRTVAAAIALAGASVLALRIARRRGYVAAGWFWYLGTLVPVIGLVQVGGQAMADRYTYLPLVGLFILASWGGWDLAGPSPRRRALAGLAAALAVGAFAAAARSQLGHWRNGVALFTRAIEVTTDNWLAHANLGGEMLERGRYAEAVAHFSEAARIVPDSAGYRYKLGFALAAGGDNAAAASAYREALRLHPGYLEARNNLGSVLFELGREREALDQFAQALRTEPKSDLAHYNIAEIRRKQGRFALAVEHYDAALRINPGLGQARIGLGIARLQLARERRGE